MAGSSHATHLLKTDKHGRSNYETEFPELESVMPYGGLKVMPYRSPAKTTQFKCLRRDIIIFREPSRVVFLGGSNDGSSLLYQGNDLLRLLPHAVARWEGLDGPDRVKFKHGNMKLLHSKGVRFLKWRLRLYVQELADLFGQSTAEVVYHISILERLMPGLHKVLPMYYAILNSFLFSALKAANIRNRSGQSITFRYVNVATQFQCATDRTKLFKPKEVGRGEMVHRTSSAYREIFGMVRQYVLRDLGI